MKNFIPFYLLAIIVTESHVEEKYVLLFEKKSQRYNKVIHI